MVWCRRRGLAIGAATVFPSSPPIGYNAGYEISLFFGDHIIIDCGCCCGCRGGHAASLQPELTTVTGIGGYSICRIGTNTALRTIANLCDCVLETALAMGITSASLRFIIDPDQHHPFVSRRQQLIAHFDLFCAAFYVALPTYPHGNPVLHQAK